jgi:hypothetical protein
MPITILDSTYKAYWALQAFYVLFYLLGEYVKMSKSWSHVTQSILRAAFQYSILHG